MTASREGQNTMSPSQETIMSNKQTFKIEIPNNDCSGLRVTLLMALEQAEESAAKFFAANTKFGGYSEPMKESLNRMRICHETYERLLANAKPPH